MRAIRDYCKNASVHGLKYFVQESLHWSERLFWTACCLASALAAYKVVQHTWFAFQDDAISFMSDTTYLDWNTTFPAVTVCGKEENSRSTEEYLRERKIDFEEGDDVITIYRDIAFFTALCTACMDTPDALWPPAAEFYNITLEINNKCDEIFFYCKWKGVEFDCCKKFKPIRTELGVCYSLNSLQTIEKPNPAEFLVVNRKTGPGHLEMALKDGVKILYHSPEDAPTWNTLADSELSQELDKGEFTERIFSVIETANEPQVRELSVRQRGCKFPDEIDVGVGSRRPRLYRFYSYSACIAACRFELINRICNCSLHLLPKLDANTPICNRLGLNCITENKALLTANELSANKEDNTFNCPCLPSCTESELKSVYTPLESSESAHEYSVARVKMVSLPSERLIRVVVRGKLDLVVAAGGIFGLFFGASLASAVEFVYYLLIRPLHPSLHFATFSQS